MTATPSASCLSPITDVPDPPNSPKGRLRYWADTVQEAVAELRRQLRSHDPDRADRALFAVIDLEKTRLRHGGKVSGTAVPCLADIDDDWGNPTSTVPERAAAPVEETESPPAIVAGREAGDTPPPIVPTSLAETGVEEKTSPPGPLSVPEKGCSTRGSSGRTASAIRCVQPTDTQRHPLEHPLSGTGRGLGGGVLTTSEMPTRTFSDRDDDWTRDPARNAAITDWEPAPSDEQYDREVERQREAYIEGTGCYPEDEWPRNPDYYRFRAEPRPHPAFLRWLVFKLGTGDDVPPVGVGCPPPPGWVG